MQRKQKPCAPLPSNKNSRYYRPRVNVSNKNLTSWGNDGSLLEKPTNSHIFDSFWRFSCFGLAGKVCQQGISSPATATASSREGELEKMNPASRGISGVSLTPREKQKKKASPFSFLQCYSAADGRDACRVDWFHGDQFGGLLATSPASDAIVKKARRAVE